MKAVNLAVRLFEGNETITASWSGGLEVIFTSPVDAGSAGPGWNLYGSVL
jgi:hypothetical protein